jgi:transcriptional regulator with XRE-family HTH domain
MGTTNLNRLKVVLVEQNKTGKWLAEQLIKSTCSVSKLCQNTVQPDLRTFDKISILLDVGIRELLVGSKKTATNFE